MPRSSRIDAEKHRMEIEKAAARLFRQRGGAGVSVAEVMSEVGLTHGGFYKHFASKEALAQAACNRAFRETEDARATWTDASRGGERTLRAFVGSYLSRLHRDHPGHGCPMVALAADVARCAEGDALQSEYVAGLQGVLDEIISLTPGANRQQAVTALAALVGALTIARATKGHAISEEVLDAVRTTLVRGGGDA